MRDRKSNLYGPFSLFLYLVILMTVTSFAEADQLYERRLDHGLTNNDPYSFLLIEESKKSHDRRSLLELAKRHSPDLPAPYFYIAADRLNPSLNGLFETIDYIRQGLRAYGRNFLWRFNLWGLLIKSLLISLLLSILIMSIIRFPYEVSLLMHEVKEDRKKTYLLFLPLIFSLFGLLPFLVSILSLYGLYLIKRDRGIIYLSFVLLLSLSLSPGILRIFSIPSYIKAAIAVNEGRDNKYGLLVLRGRADLPSSFSYALALKREGYHKEAVELYKRLVERYRIPELYINLGNALYGDGDIEGAIEYYNKSLLIRPLAVAYYNLSQVSRERLDFKKGEEYFEEAARLDPEGLRRFTALGGRGPNRFVVDVKLPDLLIWSQILSESGGIIRLNSVAIITLTAILLSFFLDRGLKKRARRCRRCGEIYCNRCSKTITWKDMCIQCYGSLVRMDQMYSKDRIANLLLIYQRRTRRRSVAKLLSYLIPGSGQLYSGKVLTGFFLIWSFLFFLTAMVLSSIYNDGIYPFHHSWILPPAILGIIILYALSIIHIRREIQKGWL